MRLILNYGCMIIIEHSKIMVMNNLHLYGDQFFSLGKVNKNDMQSVYIRYLYTFSGKKCTLNVETPFKLTKEQMVLLEATSTNMGMM